MSATLPVPWMKTKNNEGGGNDELCPCAALKNHLTVDSAISGSLSLFGYTTTDGHQVHTLKHALLKFVNGIEASAGLYHILGQCLRLAAPLSCCPQASHLKW